MSNNTIPPYLEQLYDQWSMKEEQRRAIYHHREAEAFHRCFTFRLKLLLSSLNLPTETKELILKQDELLYRKALSETTQAR